MGLYDFAVAELYITDKLQPKDEVEPISTQLRVRKGVPGPLQLQDPRAKPQGTENCFLGTILELDN